MKQSPKVKTKEHEAISISGSRMKSTSSEGWTELLRSRSRRSRWQRGGADGCSEGAGVRRKDCRCAAGTYECSPASGRVLWGKNSLLSVFIKGFK